MFAATPHYIQKLCGDTVKPILMAQSTDNMPSGIEVHKVTNLHQAAEQAHQIGADIFVYRPHRKLDNNFLLLIDRLNLATIGWAHITPKVDYLRAMDSTKAFKALVCVEREQFDQIQDTPLACSGKTSVIVNGFDGHQFRLKDIPDKDPMLVLYLGALIPRKGFHLLAKVWQNVVKRVPEAKLGVIGSGDLYNHNLKLGPLNLAEHDYETKHIMPYLCDETGAVIPSVTFFGKLGVEKKELLYKAWIGVPNPTGNTENCPGSALEFQACGTAVVSGAYRGMLDTIEDNGSGLLGKTEKDLEDNIVRLLINQEQASKLAARGMEFIEEKYNWEKVVQQWSILIKQIHEGRKITQHPMKKNYTAHYKWLVRLNHPFQKLLGSFMYWPTVAEFKVFFYPKIAKFFLRNGN